MNSEQNNPFRVPKRQSSHQGVKEFSVNAIRAWVDNLPTANVGHTARDLHTKIRQLNRQDIPPAERQQILDLMQPAMLFVLDSLSAHYKREQLPLSDKARLITELSQDLMIRMAVGSKVAANQFAENHHSFLGGLLRKKTENRALQSMFYYLGRILLQAYQLYQDPPPYLWKELHNAYHWASQHGLHKNRVAYPELGIDKGVTVSELYKQILLLSLSGPHRMFQGDVEKTYIALRAWARHCELIPFGETIAEDVKFAVYRNLDAPPAYRERLGQQEGLRGWYLDTRALSDLLSQQLENKEKKPGKKAEQAIHLQASLGTISAELKKRLMLAWGMGFKRHGEREHEPGKVQIAIGLNSVFVLLGGRGESDVSEAGVGIKEFSELTLEERAQLQGNGLISSEWNILNEMAPPAVVSLEAEREESASQRLKKISQVRVEHCDIHDKSEHGFHLEWSGTQRINPWVGEFVGISEHADLEDGAGWRMGVIRWLRDIGENHLEFGVEVVAEHAEPVMLWYVPQGSGVREEWCSLLVPDLSGSRALVAPTFFPHEQDQIFLVRDKGEERIRLTSMVEYTGYFSVFRYEYAGDGTLHSASGRDGDSKEGEEEDEDEHFKSLWHDL